MLRACFRKNTVLSRSVLSTTAALVSLPSPSSNQVPSNHFKVYASGARCLPLATTSVNLAPRRSNAKAAPRRQASKKVVEKSTAKPGERSKPANNKKKTTTTTIKPRPKKVTKKTKVTKKRSRAPKRRENDGETAPPSSPCNDIIQDVTSPSVGENLK